MPCTSPLFIKNKKYQPNKSNEGFPPPCPDPRLYSLRVPCGKCFACRKRYASDWRFRLLQEYHGSNSKFHFITLTFSDQSLHDLRNGYMTKKGKFVPGIGKDSTDNEVATVAVRRFLERYRKIYGKSLRHFFITELGEKTERIHLHGLIIDCKCGTWKRNKYYADYDKLTELWSYGNIWLGWCNDQSISYICKYITKVNPDDHFTDFTPIVLTSPGFGKQYVTSYTIKYHRFGDSGRPVWYCTTSSGHKVAIPRYYKSKLFTPEELYSRQLEILNDPPPLELNSIVYATEVLYYRALRRLHAHHIALKLCYPPKPIIRPNMDIQPNINF